MNWFALSEPATSPLPKSEAETSILSPVAKVADRVAIGEEVLQHEYVVARIAEERVDADAPIMTIVAALRSACPRVAAVQRVVAAVSKQRVDQFVAG